MKAFAVTNPGVAQIDSPDRYSAIYVLSDVHGMYDALLRLLGSAKIIDSQGHWMAGRSLLIVVGDSIDKGPKSIEVIDFWMRLSVDASNRGGGILHLLGNHEAEFLANPTGDSKAKELIAELQALGLTISDVVDPMKPRGRFLRSMPVAARVGTWLFVHSGYVEQSSFAEFSAEAASRVQAQNYAHPFFVGPQSVLEAKNWWRIDGPQRPQFERWLSANGLFGVVFGHQPSALNVEGAIAVSDDGRLIKVDNGMPPEAGAHAGNLLVFPKPQQLSTLSRPEVFSFPQPLRSEVLSFQTQSPVR